MFVLGGEKDTFDTHNVLSQSEHLHIRFGFYSVMTKPEKTTTNQRPVFLFCLTQYEVNIIFPVPANCITLIDCIILCVGVATLGQKKCSAPIFLKDVLNDLVRAPKQSRV